MTSNEKRRSSRKSGGHRKHSDGGFSDASSGGSFLDETDREVSNLTDRAFRSLCIGDEAVYNDSDLSLSSPSTNSDRQLAFCRGSEERERDDRKRTAQDNFNVRVQQYGQDWITGGMYRAEIHRGPQWEACGERTQGMVSATFQQSLVETSQLGKSQMEEDLSFLSNGATELSSQQRRSHSRVSSLTRAFDSDGHRDGVEMDHKIKERDDGTSWDKSALMSIQRELSEFSYQQNFNSHHFHRAGLLSSRDANFYSSEAETMAQISHSFMRSSQTKHSMSSQVNGSSNFFIHSEFSPFRLWRDYNRFPFQPAEAAGFMHYSEFPKWYQTPMYNELYLENPAHSHHRDFRHQKNHLGLPVPLTAPRSISTSSQLQRASAVEKRCESELTVHHPHRKWTQRLGTNKLPSHRPSTASPSTEMSRRVRDTISSVKALQQKVKMMSEHNMTNQQGVFSGNDSWVHLSNNALTVDTNVVSSNTANPFRIGQLLTPSVHQHRDAETSHLHQHEVSSQPVEHPPVRAESRGATPDIRMSNYRSRATSLLFNLKDNRKRVKSTYSPTKFKGLDTATKNQQSSVHELHETVFTDSDMQCLQPEAHRRTNSAVNQYHTPGLTTQTSPPVKVNTGQYQENTASNYQAAPMQGQMGYGSAFSGFVSSKYFNNQVAGNGQHLNKTLASFTPYRQDIYGSAEEVMQSNSAAEKARMNVENYQHKEYLIGKGNTVQASNETTGRVITKVDIYEQLKENKNISLQDNWRQLNSQDTENTHLKRNVSAVTQETISLLESSKHENVHDGKKKQLKTVNLTQNYNRFTDQYGRDQQKLYFTSDKPMTMIKTGHIKQNIPVLNEIKHTKLNPTSTPSTVAMTNQVKNTQTVDTKYEQVMASHKKPQYPQAELAKTQQKYDAKPPKTESAGFISAEQTGLETVKTQESKSEPTELQNIRQVKQDHIVKTEDRKDQHKEKLRDKCFPPKEEKQIQAEKEIVQELADEPTNVTEKVPEKLKTEQAETERLKKEHIKTELAMTEAPEWVRINQVNHEQAGGVQAEEKQQGTEKVEGEQMVAEKIKMEKVKAEQIRGEQKEQIKEPQTKTRDIKRMEVEVLEVKTDHMKVEDVREAREEKESSQTHQIELERATSSTCGTENTRAEKAKLEENLEKKESELSKTEKLLEKSAKLSAKLASKQQVRQEPDRVEQVKTELAKAKAELAKIKEKMKGEQKEKVRNILFTKEEVTLKNDDPINTYTSSKNQNHPAELQIHAVVDDYERLREKYGFTHAESANNTKGPVMESVSSNDGNKTKAGTGNNLKSVDGPCLNDLFLTLETENKGSITSFKHSEETGSQCDHRESLNTPQLSRSHCDKANRGNVAEKLKENSGQKLEKCDAIKDTTSLQKDSVSVKHERKSADQHISTGKHMAVSRALSQKEKAQTKQEILTSKIKAHAEKEISAIKEKGFTLPEGFIGKSSTKQLASGQSVNIRQRPHSQEVPKKHESTVSNKITPMHHEESSGVQKEPAKFAFSLSSDTVGGSGATTVDCLQKPTRTIQPTGTIVSSAESCVQKEPEVLQQKEANHIKTSRKQTCELQQVVNDETLDKTKQDLAQCASISKPVTKEDTKKKEAAQVDLEHADCVNQKEPSVTDDSVQIMGIMVTVVERKLTVSTGPQNNNAEKQTIASEKEGNKSFEEIPSQEEVEVLVKAKDSKKSQPIMKEDEATLGKNSYSGNVQDALTLGAINREVTAEMADLHLNSCTIIAELQTKRQPEAVTVSVKDKLLAETQLLRHQMDVTLEETKDVTVKIPKEHLSESSRQTKRGDEESQQKMQKPFMNEVSCDKVNKVDNDRSVKDDMTTGKNLSKSNNKDGQCAPLPGDNICPSTSPSSFSIGSPSKNSPRNETRCVSQNMQTNETYIEEYSQDDTSVHINNIAIRVVPAGGTKDNVNMSEKCDIKTIPSNLESAYEQKQVATSISEGRAKISNNGHCSENLMQAKSEQKVKDSLEEKLAVQKVLSSVRKLSNSLKASDKQNNANTTSEHIKAEDKKSESDVQLVETEYFQVQGPAETSNMSHNNITAKNDSKGMGVLELLHNKTFIGNELQKEQNSDVFVFTVDPNERKADQSSLTNIQAENLTRKNLENKDNTVPFQCSNNNKKMEASQSNPTRKHNEENQCDSSAIKRQNSSNHHLTNTHLAQETSEIKSKPKERVSAIPEISAIADYARLKVIVSEDKEIPQVQQFPPNKKEGFFPLIQTRRSRCPVFTEDPQDLSVKTHSLPNKTEIGSIAANKEPKLLVFPIMEKEHQRTGMFKLGDKERQEKMNTKMNICLLDNESHVDQTVKNKSSTAKTEVEAPLAQEHQRRAAEEEQQRKVAYEEQQRREVEEQQKMGAQMELQSRLAEEKHVRKTLHEEQQRRAAEKQQKRAAKVEPQSSVTEEEQRRKAAHEEQQRREVEEQQKWLAEEEQHRKAAHEEQQRREVEEQQRWLAEEEQRRKAAHEKQQSRAGEEQQRRLPEEEQLRKVAHEEQQRRGLEEQQKRAAQMKIQRRLAEEEQKGKAPHEEQQRVAEEQQKRVVQVEQHRRLAEEEQKRIVTHEELQRRDEEEQQKRAAQMKIQKRIAEEEQIRQDAYVEQQRREREEQQRAAAQLEQQRRLAEEEQKRKAALEEQLRREVEEQQKRLAEEEQRRQDAHKEQQRRVTEEQQKRDAQVEQQRRLAEEEQKKRKVEEQQKRAAHMEIQKRLEEEEFRRQYAHEEQQRKEAAEQQMRLTEGPHMRKGAFEQERKTEQKQHGEAEQQQKRSLQDEQQRKATEEKQRRPSQLEQTEEAHEQHRKAAQEEKQREVKEEQQRVAQNNKQRIVSPEEQTRRDIDEQERTAAHNEQQRKAAHREKQKRTVQDKQQKRDLEEDRKRVAQEKQQRTTSLIEEQRQVKQVKEIVAHNQKEANGKPRERINVVLVSEKGSIKQIQEHIKMQHQTEEPIKEEKTTSQKTLENETKSAEKEKITRERKIEKHLKHESVKAQESTLTKTDNDIQPKKIKGDEQLTSLKEKARYLHMGMEKRAAQKSDALQFYAITSTNREKRPGERQLPSPLPLQQQNKKQMELESPNNLLYHTRPYRPAAAASPAPSLPRSNTSSPALGTKPLMFRVKDNTNRGSSFTKSVKPHFHKNFGEDFLMGLTLEGRSDKTEEDQEIIRRNAGTPLNRFSAISESATFLSPSSSQDYSNSIPHLRPYSRRSMAVDDDESRSVISNMSEDVESFATSAADLTDMHGLFDNDRPESVCSFSSDVSRSLGKPPTVPPKSEKALRRAQRLTYRRIKKELSKAVTESPTGVVKEVSSFPSSPSSSNEVCSSNHHAVASPHFSPPVAFALAPTVGSSMPSSHKDHKSSHCSLHASPHATGRISIPSSSPCAASAFSLHACSPASKPAVLQTVAHVSSSPTLHHVNHPATPVTQYHVESTNYPQSYPATQRKVLQDLGSGQYFVVDVPVQVKTKTFFDPETGKYVQLNVRQTGQNISQPQLQQAYQQPEVQPQMQIKQQQPISSVVSGVSKPLRFHQNSHSPAQNYQTAVANSLHPSSSLIPATLHQNQQVLRENHSYGNPVPGVDQNSEGHRYSPEKTPYMDTVNDITKTHNLVNSPADACNPSLECDTNSQLSRSSVCENDLSANSECRPRDIIAISELEDFMEVCDW
ncbi:uncharacterized protein LOC124859195 isoform X2 [Girardinichthys multiradiatus]|uniref:uncharacterized protein LOC124859195 isoform X2 n=1 Tax=Girardinichthys multiradiatus TaxID=208333 RepID=UPI001FACE362|nr:uncharacterized protein LOC124859195 isoform X2 [Girardinichthys multiradiatus]